MSTVKADAYLDSAGGNAATINGLTPALASQAEAESGTNNANLMTPLRVSQEMKMQTVRKAYAATSAPGSAPSLLFLNLPPASSLHFDLSFLQCSVTTSTFLQFRASTDNGATFIASPLQISAAGNWNTSTISGRLTITNVVNAVSGTTRGFEFSTSSNNFNVSTYFGVFPNASAVSGNVNAVQIGFASGNMIAGNIFVTGEYLA